ncbi:hypothetical protein G7039_09145 [Rhizobium leguminosarum]|uniref:hypothetical protein n=1 Tax=Rhizobium ruizarguesonis TaxID=2081791 RepID=UPI0013E00D6D|nr:hypothetical protein [Rhizobium ruizarguesonis]NEJ95269.1 hypothetical protein [Rhizobium ruizarguesonis]QIJ40282.1 hypothetical protein G7039_09145 [Rhizobium leguminosarum]
MTDDVDRNKKTERLHMLISPAEIEAIDTWRFKNRVATRADAVRRLTQLALCVDEPLDGIYHQAKAAYVDLFSRTAIPSDAPVLGSHIKAFKALMLGVGSVTEQVHRLRGDSKAIDVAREVDEILKTAEEKTKILRAMRHPLEDEAQPKPED